jgi:hypothetical protein
VGDYIYVPFDDGGHWSAPCLEGGLAKVRAVKDMGTYAMVETEEQIGHQRNWSFLAVQQADLHAQYGLARAGERA